ncbi:efflux RND transporter periplasmic adaptor subunit [Isosphaeraceae bacterium EP7]
MSEQGIGHWDKDVGLDPLFFDDEDQSTTEPLTDEASGGPRSACLSPSVVYVFVPCGPPPPLASMHPDGTSTPESSGIDPATLIGEIMNPQATASRSRPGAPNQAAVDGPGAGDPASKKRETRTYDPGIAEGPARRRSGAAWVRTLITLVIGASLVGGLTAANIWRERGSFDLDWHLLKVPAVELRTELPTRGPIVRKITAPGEVEPIEEAKVGSQISGRVVAVNVKSGDYVKAGQVLVRLDDADARARLTSSQARSGRLRAAIDQAETDLAKASRDQMQFGKLANRGFSAPNELADARSLVSKSEAALQMCRQELSESEALWQISREELKRTEILAPIDGVVARVDVAVGEIVIAGTPNLPGSILMTVSDLTHMRVSAEVDESDIPMILPGQRARVFLQSGGHLPIEATVDKVAPKGRKKNDSVSFETRVSIDKPDPALRAGMTATVEIEVRRVPDAFGSTVQAVVHRKRKDLPDTPEVRAWAERNARSPGESARDANSRYIKVVFVAEKGVARARPVETGLSDERRVEILSGLGPDDRVVVGPFRALDELRDGQPVRESTETGDRR